MKRKCTKCQGKGGTSKLVKDRWGMEIWITERCVECLDRGYNYSKIGHSRTVRDRSRKLRSK